jgi:uncharacterized protein (DUF1778 family)
MAELLLERGRISARCAKAQQDTIDTAAALTGASINQFVLQAALEKAEQVIERERRIAASGQDAAMIMAMLENPPEPNAALASLLQDYREKVENGQLHSSARLPPAPRS